MPINCLTNQGVKRQKGKAVADMALILKETKEDLATPCNILVTQQTGYPNTGRCLKQLFIKKTWNRN